VPIEGRLQISPEDVMLFLLGECDENKIEELLWGFTLINWRKPGSEPIRNRWKKPLVDEPLSRPWCLLKLLHSPYKIRDIEIKRETRVANLLLSGHIQDACDVAIHRLFVSGLAPYQVGYGERLNPILILASLLIPIRDQWKLENLVLKPTTLK
jgi:CRISPR-associated protein Csx17